jgi:hypothetical protein
VTPLDVATVAGLFAERSRAAMVDVLLEGRDHTVRTQMGAGVAAPTATEQWAGQGSNLRPWD